MQNRASGNCIGYAIGEVYLTAIILEPLDGSRKSKQYIDVPGESKNCLITSKVTTEFFDSLCTPISCVIFSRPTEDSRIILESSVGQISPRQTGTFSGAYGTLRASTSNHSQTMQQDNNDIEEGDDDYKSKSQIKREMVALQELARKLIQSAHVKAETLPVDERIKTAILAARSMKKQALKRQIQYIGGLLQHENETEVQAHLNQAEQPQRASVARFHELEQLRDALIAEQDHAFNAVLGRFPQADRQHLRQLVRNAKKEAAKQLPPKSSRAIFRYLRELQEAED